MINISFILRFLVIGIIIYRRPGFSDCCGSFHPRIINNVMNHESWKFQKNQRKKGEKINNDFIRIFHVSPTALTDWNVLIWMQISIVLWLSAHSLELTNSKSKNVRKWNEPHERVPILSSILSMILNRTMKENRYLAYETNQPNNISTECWTLTQTRSPSIGIAMVDLCDHGAKIQCASTSELF